MQADAPVNPLDYLFVYAYPAAFLGAIFFSINSFMNLKPLSAVANGHIEMALNAYVAVSGFLAMLLWLQPWNLGVLSTLLNGITTSLKPVYNVNSIKTTSSS